MAKKELAELTAFAEKEHGMSELQAWDVPYYGEKLRKHTFDFSEEDIKPYFPETKVLEGLFTLTEKLFGIHVSESKKVETWHPDVRFFELYDQKGKKRGSLYMDLYVRKHKRGGACLEDCQNRRKLEKKP